MKASQAAYDLIKHWEGFESRPYICAGGYTTIGFGHVVKRGEIFHEIDREQAEKLLIQDVRAAENVVNRAVKVPLHQEHFDGLVSLVFNIGGPAFERSTLLRKLNSGDYLGAGREFERWVYARKKKLTGLVRRRSDEKDLFLKLPWRG